MRLSVLSAVASLMFLFALSACSEKLCDDSCPFANDGVCDDGGADAINHVCQLGTDCNDCGEREI